ncbi:hypothetical protein NQ318_016466 [Aromia moschata]|uniref:Uncharacterized protein n=1 Tax=Aromia moschata TaxID=1265417 RepID=A0AAV8Z6F1_9CUCU|nr:hypothetical protein NQ318_016466 [Aromia moschata]
MSAYGILSDILGMKRVAARLVPKELNVLQKEHRKVALGMASRADSEPNFMKRIITGDETWEGRGRLSLGGGATGDVVFANPMESDFDHFEASERKTPGDVLGLEFGPIFASESPSTLDFFFEISNSKFLKEFADHPSAKFSSGHSPEKSFGVFACDARERSYGVGSLSKHMESDFDPLEASERKTPGDVSAWNSLASLKLNIERCGLKSVSNRCPLTLLKIQGCDILMKSFRQLSMIHAFEDPVTDYLLKGLRTILMGSVLRPHSFGGIFSPAKAYLKNEISENCYIATMLYPNCQKLSSKRKLRGFDEIGL